MKQPKVSIVVNNYNGAEYLRECLDSLIRQTYKNIEIVIIDAFSSDNSRKIISEYASKYKNKIKAIFTDKYIKYPAISYNIGFLNCSADFIAINDSDDISMPSRIEKQVAFLLDNSEVDVVGSNFSEFNIDFERNIKTTVEENVRKAYPPARNPTLMFRKNVIAAHGLWRWHCEYAADFEWLYRWYSQGVKFYIIQDELVRYRYSHGGNLSIVYAINQAYKLALFRTYFGLKGVKGVGISWWIKTLDTYYYLVSLSVKWCFKRIFFR